MTTDSSHIRPGLLDTSAQMTQVASAIALGSQAAMSVVQSLLAEDVGLPIPEWTGPPQR